MNSEMSARGQLRVGHVLAAMRQFRSPRDDEQPEMPKWMATIDKTTWPPRLAWLPSCPAPTPKSAARSRWRRRDHPDWHPGAQQAIAYLIFALIATLGVGIPVVLYFAMGQPSEKLLVGLRDWMSAHNAVIMAVMCLVIAAKLIGDGTSDWASPRNVETSP
jgi:Sap-like sulfolipid-1-addressing protein